MKKSKTLQEMIEERGFETSLKEICIHLERIPETQERSMLLLKVKLALSEYIRDVKLKDIEDSVYTLECKTL